MNKPTIAVAIACHNQAHFLDDAIRSVIGQTRQADAIILVNDGSTDGTAAVARAYPQLHHLHQANAGLSAARNAACAATDADYILFLDADDVLYPSALAHAENCLSSSPKLAFVYGGYERTDQNGRVLSRHVAVPMAEPSLDLLRGNCIAMHGTVLYRRPVLHASGGFDVKLRSCEDYDVYLRLARTHAVAAYHAIAAGYRQHGQGMSGHNLRMVATSRMVIRRHARAASRDPAYKMAAAAGLAFMTDYYTQALLDSLEQAWSERRFGRALQQLFADARSYPGAAVNALWSGFVVNRRPGLRSRPR